MEDFDTYWTTYCTRHTVLQAGKIRITGENLKRIAREAHIAGHRRDKFEIFWFEILEKYPNVGGTKVLISTSSIENLAKKAYHKPEEKWTEKLGKGVTSFLEDLAEVGSDILKKKLKK